MGSKWFVLAGFFVKGYLLCQQLIKLGGKINLILDSLSLEVANSGFRERKACFCGHVSTCV